MYRTMIVGGPHSGELHTTDRYPTIALANQYTLEAIPFGPDDIISPHGGSIKQVIYELTKFCDGDGTTDYYYIPVKGTYGRRFKAPGTFLIEELGRIYAKHFEQLAFEGQG